MKIERFGKLKCEKKQKINEKWKSVIFGPWKAEIGLGTAIFGISVKNYTGFRNSRPNPCLEDLFRGRPKISGPTAPDGK